MRRRGRKVRGGTKEIVEGNFLKEKEMWKIKKKKDKKFRENITIFTDSSKKEAEYHQEDH